MNKKRTFDERLENLLATYIEEDIETGDPSTSGHDAIDVIAEIIASTAVFYEKQISAFFKMRKYDKKTIEKKTDELLEILKRHILERCREFHD